MAHQGRKGKLMLVLTRKLGQTITIGDPNSAEKAIEVTVEEIGAGQVRLSIAAPKETAVHRKEVWEDIQANGQKKGTEA